MQFLPIGFLFFFALLSCKDAEAPPASSQRPEPLKPGKTVDKTPFPDEKIFRVENIGVSSMDGLIPFATIHTADGGSHQWIYKLSDDGKAEWALLLIRWEGRRMRMEDKPIAYLETYEAGWKLREQLTTKETLAKLETIKTAIFAEGHRERYEFFYDGGVPEPKKQSDDPDDPFAEPKDGRTQDEKNADFVKEVNDFALSGITTWAYYFRMGNKLPLYDFPEGSVGQTLKWAKVKEVMVYAGDYEPLKRPPKGLNTRFMMGEVVRQIGFQKAEGKPSSVFTPLFATLVLLGGDEDPVSIISVQPASAYCIAHAGVRDKEGRYIIDHDTIQAEFHSLHLTKLLYESFAENDPEYLKEMREFFKGSRATLEEQVLGKE